MTKHEKTNPSELLDAAEEFSQSEQERVERLRTEISDIHRSMFKLQKSHVIEIKNPVNCDQLTWVSHEGNVKSFLVDTPEKVSEVKLKSDEQNPDGIDEVTLNIFVTTSHQLQHHLTVSVNKEVEINAEILNAEGKKLSNSEAGEVEKINMTNSSYSDLTMKSLRLEMAENAVLYAKAQLLGEIRTATTRMQGKRVVEIISPTTK